MLATRMRSIQPALINPIALPTFSSYTSGDYTVSSNSEFSGTYSAYNAFNRSNSTYSDTYASETSTVGTAYLLLDCGFIKSINKYKVQGYYTGEYYPTTWTLYGSDNNIDWTTIDSKTDQNTSSLQSYLISTVSYRYYKFLTTAVFGADTRTLIGILDYEYV